MNTPAHAILNLCLLGRKEKPSLATPILFGAFLPDMPMVFFYGYVKLIQNIPEQVIWSETYFKPFWQNIFDIFNSLPLILVAMAVALFQKSPWFFAFFSSMAFHVFGDFPFHHDDAHRHFLPFSHWRFASPVSYWDPQHYGQYVSLLEASLVLIGSFFLFRRYESKKVKVFVAAVGLIYLLYWGYAIWMWVD